MQTKRGPAYAHNRKVRRARNLVKRYQKKYPALWPNAEIGNAVRQKRWERAWALIVYDELSKP